MFERGNNKMSEIEFDFVVIGGGIVGSWTAKELIKYGSVLLLEQFQLPHTRGSSTGQTRIIRSSYQESFYAEMMPHAFKMWKEAEDRMDEKLIETTGILCFADSADDKSMRNYVNNMKRFCPENLVEITGKDLKSKYPTTLKYPEDVAVVLDKSGGVLFANKAVKTIQKWFQNLGGLIWDGCAVTNIIPSGENNVKIFTDEKVVSTRAVAICTGPWTKKLLGDLAPSLPLEPQSVKVLYWKEKVPGAYSATSGFPITLTCTHPNVFTFPSLEYPGLLKAGVHGGVPSDPDERDKVPADPKLEKLIKAYIMEHFPLLEAEPSLTESCMYTCTPDEIFVVDYLPGYKNIVLGAGFSGTGFKTAPVVGRLLSELARGEDPFLDISPYRLSRFTTSKRS